MWSTTTNAISDLRRLLSDGDTDKLCDLKLVFGKIDGLNTRFKTFERRRVTDFSAAIVSPSPVGVYKNNVRLNPAADVALDDLISGSFTVNVAPIDGDEIRATYYYRWFLDPELDQFLTNAAQWLGLGSNYLVIPDGLIPSALHYAGQEAYDRLALWFSTKSSNVYLLDDAPDSNNQGVIDSYNKLSEKCQEKAHKLRDDFYTRQGQSLSPRFAVQAGRVRDLVPKR